MIQQMRQPLRVLLVILFTSFASTANVTVVNLVSNALRFSRSGGAVDLECSRHDGRLRFTVSDRGPGIPDEFKDRIFEKFCVGK